MYPDLDDPSALLTQFTVRSFALVRNITGFDVHPQGQEPVNAVLYKNPGDQYKPHCDGSCNGGQYAHGTRVGTSIAYCRTSNKGGQTSFTVELVVFVCVSSCGGRGGTLQCFSTCVYAGDKSLMYGASSDTRKATRAATSSTRP